MCPLTTYYSVLVSVDREEKLCLCQKQNLDGSPLLILAKTKISIVVVVVKYVQCFPQNQGMTVKDRRHHL
jgi:hypothetical protein